VVCTRTGRKRAARGKREKMEIGNEIMKQMEFANAKVVPLQHQHEEKKDWQQRKFQAKDRENGKTPSSKKGGGKGGGKQKTEKGERKFMGNQLSQG